MSILGNILGGIFNKKDAPKPAPAPTAAPAATAAPAPTAAPVAAAPAEPVDVAGILDFKNSVRDEKLNWRTSIVDLMKLLDIDSSLENRKALAHELGYAGDTGDSAAMNIWLHKQVMQRVAENGGIVPANLTD